MYVCPSCGFGAGAPGFCTEDGAALADASGDEMLGQNVGSYRIARHIGQGGMGAVYLGVQPAIGSRVAIKVLSPGAASTAGMVDRFFSEARAVNVIRHEGIVNVLDLSRLPDGRPYIVMEYLEGGPLSEHFAAHRPFPLGTLCRIGFEVASALEAAHAHGVTHRDLKPDNVFVTHMGRVKVLDFGIAKLKPELGGQSDVTRTGALLGTPHYMSPEQARGQPADPRSDFYSLGVILYEGATGRRPFEADSLFDLLKQHIEVLPRHPGELRPDLPPGFAALILRAMAKEREARFQTASELSAALAQLLPNLPDTAIGALPTRVTSVAPPSAPTKPLSGASVAGAVTHPLPAPRAEPRSGSSLGYWVGAFGLLVALGAVAAAIVFFFVVGRDSINVTVVAPTADTGNTDAGPFAHWDPAAGLNKAREEARKHFADADLTTISLVGLNADGTLDLADPSHAAAFIFRSPSASKTGKKCIVTVSINQYGTFSAPTEDTSQNCTQPTVRAPRCTLKALMRRAPSGAKTAIFYNVQSNWNWTFTATGSGTTLPDDC